jgi:GTP-binding protein EngB required for normal cell division/uncharacterized protein (DUF697 family)
MIKVGKKLRFLMAMATLLLTALLLLFLFFATRSAFDIWDRIQKFPDWLFYSYLGIVGLILLVGIWTVIKLLWFSKKQIQQSKEVTRESIMKELEHAEETGMETSDLRRELEVLEERKETGQIHIALFGDVSTGKSSIIKALLPGAAVETHIRGGSTQEIAEYTWTSSSGDKLILTDLPGRNEASGSLDEMAQDEAVRSQVVIYVTDTDLTRTQHIDIQVLQSYGKPLIIAINKSDRFNEEEQELIASRINEHFEKPLKIAFITSGGEEEILKIYPDGREETVLRPRKAHIEPLAELLQDEIDAQAEILESLRDASVFVLVKQKLDVAKIEHQREKAEKIIKSSTRKAVLGALAALTPGADLVIQGVLGRLMVKELCKLYDIPVKQLDIDNFINFSQGHLKKSVPLLLAVAGNGLKAFPGVGTVAGGLIHAVAYGIIFDALGRAVVKTLEQRGKLKAAPASLTFKEMLGENLESRAKLFAKLVFDNQREKGK